MISRFWGVAMVAAMLGAGGAHADELILPSPVDADSLALRETYRNIVTASAVHDSKVVQWTERHAGHLHVGFLFDLSRRLLERDPSRALEWYAVAVMRGAYDAEACADKTIPRIVQNLSQNAIPVVEYVRTHPQAYANAAMKAMARSDVFSVRGSLCLPMDAAIETAIAQTVRDEFGRQFDPMAPSAHPVGSAAH